MPRLKLFCNLTAIGCLPACMQNLAAALITEPIQAKQTDSDMVAYVCMHANL